MRASNLDWFDKIICKIDCQEETASTRQPKLQLWMRNYSCKCKNYNCKCKNYHR